MARKLNRFKKSENVRIHLILPGGLVAQLDAIAKKRASASPGLTVTRTDVLKMAAHAYVEAAK